MGSRAAILITAALAGMILLAQATSAMAATVVGAHVPLVGAGILGDIFGSIGHAVLGAFSWTIGLASRFILTTVGALVRMLIPRSWASEGVQVMQWIVAVPDYAGTITSPSGQTVYGFGGINALRELMTWIGIGLLPLTLVYGTARAMISERGHAAGPLARVLAVAVMLLFYGYLWSQAAALTNTVTHLVLALPAVTTGLHQLMLYAVDGVALGGWQLIDLALMALVAAELLSLIFFKVVLVLFGALLYAAGPVTIALAATDAGAAIARAWSSAVLMLIVLPIAWALLFAVGALLVGDAGTAGPLIAGHTSVGALLGGVLLAGAGAAALWMCLRAAREAGGLLRVQLGGLLALGHHTSTRAVAGSASRTSSADSLRNFGTRVARAGSGAASELALAGAGGAALAGGGRALAHLGRHGLIGSAAIGVRAAGRVAAPYAAGQVGRSRAGAVAVRMAKAGTASWQAPQNAGSPGGPGGAAAVGSHAAQPSAGAGISYASQPPRGSKAGGASQTSPPSTDGSSPAAGQRVTANRGSTQPPAGLRAPARAPVSPTRPPAAGPGRPQRLPAPRPQPPRPVTRKPVARAGKPQTPRRPGRVFRRHGGQR